MRRFLPTGLPAILVYGAVVTAFGLIILSAAAIGEYAGWRNIGPKIEIFSWFLAFFGTGLLAAFAIAFRELGEAFDERTERQLMHEKLASTASLLQTIISATPGLIYANDVEGRLILANPATLALIGRPWPEIEGCTAADYFTDATQAVAVMANDRRIMDGGIAETIEESVSTPTGARYEWLSTKAPLCDADGKVIGIVGMSMDITERKAAATKLEVLGNELAHMGRLNAMGELSLALAHEINQPLAAIVNHIAIAEHAIAQKLPGADSDIAKRLRDATDQAMRAGGIVKRLSAFAESHEPEMQPENVAELVTEAAELISGMLNRKGLRIAIFIEDFDARILADRIQIQQVVINLVRNASEAVENLPAANPEISLTVRSREESIVEIIVEDDGPGISAAERIELFERFSTVRHRESDLGIPISLRILESHDGRLSYDSGIDGGARLIATLPLLTSAQDII